MVPVSAEVHKIMVEQLEEAFKAQKEPPDKMADKKLIINAAVSGGVLSRYHNPNLPVTTEEVTREVRDAYNAGAAIWHIHPRDPETGGLARGDLRTKVHKEWCDSVFQLAPDIITNVGHIYGPPTTLVEGTSLVDEESLRAEYRIAPVVEPVIELGPNNRYIEMAISLVRSFALGGSKMLSFNPRVGVQYDLEYFQSKGIKVELSPFSYVDVQDTKAWLIDTGLAQPPVIFDTLIGLHNAPNPKPCMEAIDYQFTLFRALPKGVLWQALVGGRYWLPLASAAIMLGADMVRVGLEDSTYMYPHSTELLKGNGKIIEAVAGIARYLGREVATPSEAREILGLPQISK